MTVKELRQSLRRGSFVIPFIGIHVLAVIAMGAEFARGDAGGTSEYIGAMNPWVLVNSGPFWMVVGAVCLVLLPLGGLALMGQEMEDGNRELLLLTSLDRRKVVWGKFFALWGLTVVTFVSLMPYVVVRYLVGGVEWWHELVRAVTVLAGAAMIGAGAIGASSFRGMGARTAVFVLFVFSMFFGCLIPMAGAAAVGRGMGVFYHVTAICAVVCYTIAGLALARSRLRVAVMAYEVNPGNLPVALLIFAPFAIGLATAVTLGVGGFVALLLVALVAWKGDSKSKPGPNVWTVNY